jgi:heme/copper-type cytochrome/quinol oxidase subunit 3
VETIRAALEIGKSPKKSLRRERNANSASPLTPRLLGICSFGFSFIWATFLFASPPGNNRAKADLALILVGLIVLIASGIGTCAAMILGRSQHTKDLWISVFGGWLLGMMVGMYLFSNL